MYLIRIIFIIGKLVFHISEFYYLIVFLVLSAGVLMHLLQVACTFSTLKIAISAIFAQSAYSFSFGW